MFGQRYLVVGRTRKPGRQVYVGTMCAKRVRVRVPVYYVRGNKRYTYCLDGPCAPVPRVQSLNRCAHKAFGPSDKTEHKSAWIRRAHNGTVPSFPKKKNHLPKSGLIINYAPVCKRANYNCIQLHAHKHAQNSSSSSSATAASVSIDKMHLHARRHAEIACARACAQVQCPEGKQAWRARSIWRAHGHTHTHQTMLMLFTAISPSSSWSTSHADDDGPPH